MMSDYLNDPEYGLDTRRELSTEDLLPLTSIMAILGREVELNRVEQHLVDVLLAAVTGGVSARPGYMWAPHEDQADPEVRRLKFAAVLDELVSACRAAYIPKPG